MDNIIKYTKRCLELHLKGKKKKYIDIYINKRRIPKFKKLYIKSCHSYNTGCYAECVKHLTKLNKVYNKFDSHLYITCLENLEGLDLKEALLNTKKIYYLFNLDERNHLVQIFNRSGVGSCLESLSNFVNPSTMGNKVITNCLYDGCSSGVGDFLRGSTFLFELLNPFDVKLEVDMSNHILYDYLKIQSDVKLAKEDIFDTAQFSKDTKDYITSLRESLANKMSSDRYDVNIFTHLSDLLYSNVTDISDYTLTEDCRKFFQNKIHFSDDVVSSAEKIIDTDYDIVHFRCGDYELVDDIEGKGHDNQNYKVDYEVCLNYAKSCITDKPLVLLSDSNNLKKYIYQMCDDIIVMHTNSCHTSKNPGNISKVDQDKEKMFYVALDMFLVTKASSVYSYSVYPWGSGFTFWLSKIYNLPIQCKSLINE